MAAYNEITLPRWQNLVRRLFGLQGPGGNVPLITPEIQPIAIIQPESCEFPLMRGEVPYGGHITQVGAAGLRPIVALVNPAGSNTLVLVDIIEYQAIDTAPQFIEAIVSSTTQGAIEAIAPTLSNTILCRDGRRTFFQTQAGAAVMRQGQTNTVFALFFSGRRFGSSAVAAFNATAGIARGIVLVPGQGVVVSTLVAGTAAHRIDVNWEWRERQFDDAAELIV